jgi:hypothetical protein
MLSVALKARSRSRAQDSPSTSPLRGYAQGERRRLDRRLSKIVNASRK